MKTYLVTGGCGFIGVNLIPRLIEQGVRVRVLDNLSLGRREDVEPLGVDLHVGDIRDPSAVAKACNEIDAAGTLNVLQACRNAGIPKMIFASTGGAILGEQEPPVHEGMVPRPISPYGASKLAGDAYCSAYTGAYGLKTAALRFSNVYGPYSYHKGSVVAQFFRNILRGEPIVVYGDGEQTRDFLYVADLVEAILLADKTEPAGEVFQIASGRETSVRNLLEAMKAMLPERRFDIRFEPARAGEILRNYANVEKARRILGFDPKTQLSEGLRKTWQWFISHDRDSKLK